MSVTNNLLQRNQKAERVQVFAIGEGITIPLGAFAPTNDMIVRIATDVTITVSGVAVGYVAGDVFGLYQDQDYSFSAAVSAHVMV